MAQLKKVQISNQHWKKVKSEALVVGVFKGGGLSPVGKDVNSGFNGVIKSAIKNGDFKGKSNETLMLYTGGSSSRILLVGLGKKKEFDLEKLRQAGGTAAKVLQGKDKTSASAEIPGMDSLNFSAADTTKAFVEGAILGSYKFLDYKTDDENNTVLKSLTIVGGGSRSGLHQGKIVGESVCLARDLAAHPSNVATPSRLAS